MPVPKACISGAVKNVDIYFGLNISGNAFWTSNVFAKKLPLMSDVWLKKMWMR